MDEWRDETTDVEYMYEAGYRRMCYEMAFWVSNSSVHLWKHAVFVWRGHADETAENLHFRTTLRFGVILAPFVCQ